MVKEISARIGDRFFAAGLERPDAPALRFGHTVITYRELLRRVDGLSRHLRSLAGGRPPVAAIHSGRFPGLIVSVLACVRAGIPFAVLDSAYPRTRVSTMLAVLQPSILVRVGSAEPPEEAPAGGQEPPAWCEVDAEGEVSGGAPGGNAALPEVPVSPLAYFLFTSGTTGTPKCIQTSHAPLVHFVEWYRRQFNPGPDDQFSLLSGLGHDPILRDIFVPLSVGACLSIPSQEILTKPSHLFRWLKEERVTFVHTTPPMLKVLAAGAPPSETLPDLKWIFSGGDSLRRQHVLAVRALAPEVRLVNFYGATETPQAMGWHLVDPASEDELVPAGRGIDDVELLVLDDHNRRLGPGEEGQVGVRTRYLSEGYKDDPTQTAARFVTTEDEAVPVYLTGDRGELRVDGTLVLRGRADDQVKIRGYRVELAEVTLACHALPVVRDALVLALPDDEGENRLEAFLVPRNPVGDPNCATMDVRAALRTVLAPAQVPAVFHWLDELPLQPNGKHDRAALRARAQAARPPSACIEPDSEAPGAFAEGMRKILGVAVLRPDLSFADHGGDSLSFIRATALIERHLGALPPQWERLPLAALFSAPGTKRGWIGTVSAPVVMRAVGILLVLVGHLMNLGWAGATTALFVIAGWSLGRYQIPAVLNTDRINVLIKTVVSILVPMVLMNLALFWRSGGTTDWKVLLMINSYFSLDNNGGFWFLNVLTQIDLLLAGLLWNPQVRKFVRDRASWIWVAALLVALAFSAIEYFLQNRLPIRTPVQQLWLIFLGICIAQSETVPLKAFLAVVILLVGFDEINIYSAYAKAPVVMCWFILVFDRIPMPRLVASGVSAIAGASLYIYLTHRLFKEAVDLTPLALGGGKVAVVVAAIGGILVWRLWEMLFNPAYAWSVEKWRTRRHRP